MNMRIAYLGLLLLVQLATANIVAPPCPDGWTKSDINSLCYYYIPSEGTFNDAKRACSHVGGKIVSVTQPLDSAGAMLFIQSQTTLTKRNVWLDMVRTEDGNWTSTNGTKIVTDWHEGYPEDNSECGVLFYETGKMKNKRCSFKAAFLCTGRVDEAHPVTSTCPAMPRTETEDGTLPGTYAYVSCEQDYVVTPYGHKKTFCKKDGTWSKSVEELAGCQAKSCSEISVGEEVIEMSSGGNDVGILRNFTCPPGSVFKSQQDVSHIIIECKQDGMWRLGSGDTVSLIENCMLKPVADGKDTDGNGGGTTTTPTLSLVLVATISLFLVPRL